MPQHYTFPQAPQASLNPTVAGIVAGGSIVSAIADYLGGAQGRRDREFGRKGLKSQFGSDIFNPAEILGKRKQSFIASAQPLARRANERLGLASGRAQEELISKFATQEGDFLFDLLIRKALEESRRDVGIASQFLGSRG
ncbi:hypothetical protein LCGC14_2274860 [marine sediment metagenome]|uniref:Uncharacterized protein n=1 Tax=marine sediment metagenome TaxID=412755 RepID=A0A0F9DI39_9ZZZZ